MKRIRLAEAVISLFLVFTLIEASSVTQVTANPIWSLNVPYGAPVKDPPMISVQSLLSEKAYGSANSVSLTFTVTKPSSWFNFTNFESETATHLSCGRIDWVRYALDGNPSQTIPVNDWWGSSLQGDSAKYFNFKEILTGLVEGQHTITISAEGTTYYLPVDFTQNEMYNPPNFTMDSMQTIISFSFPEPLVPSIRQTGPSSTPTPALPSSSPNPTASPNQTKAQSSLPQEVVYVIAVVGAIMAIVVVEFFIKKKQGMQKQDP